jgi:SAM-dependent methyltransferase
VYFRCHDCHLTFIPQSLRLSPDAERGHYGVHENDPSDPNYIRFLRKSTDHLIAHMTRTHRHTSQTTDPSAPLRVIDYGCGPGPALAAIFALYAEDAAVAAEVAAAHPDVAADEVAAVARRAQLVQYDPFFAPHVAVPADWAADASDAEDGPRDAPGAAENNLDWVSRRFRFDGVVCTEVIEHAFEPLRLLASLRSLLRPGAAAVVCTTVLERDDAFNAWGYRNDLTHVCFFKEASLRWGGARAGMDVDRVARNVFLMKRKEVDGSGDISRDT